MAEVTLAEVLDARERRALRQQQMLSRCGKPLVCFTMNIAGPVKVDADTAYAFREGRRRLLEGLDTMGWPLLEQEDLSSNAGFGLLAAVDADARLIKRLCVRLEEMDDLGRLFDLDVLDAQGEKLERGSERRCLVCGLPGRGCASRRLHSVEELQAVTRRIIREHRRTAESERIASLAVQSLLDEVCVTPKPGLVDRHDNGSHRDMDIFTFNASAAALGHYFRACYLAGADTREEAPEAAFDRLNTLGIAAEGTMRRVTGSVNTHKGAIFTLGMLCGAAGRAQRPDLDAWLSACAELARGYCAPGVRAEVAAGLPAVRVWGLPALREARARGLSFNDQCLLALLRLMGGVEDTNMAARGGAEQAKACREEARVMYQDCLNGAEPQSLMAALNEAYIRKNLSPGGCADLLAATLLADRWTRE